MPLRTPLSLTRFRFDQPAAMAGMGGPQDWQCRQCGRCCQELETWLLWCLLVVLLACAQNYDLIYRASQENAWLPLELMNACIAGFAGVTEAEVFKYICILEENTQRGRTAPLRVVRKTEAESLEAWTAKTFRNLVWGHRVFQEHVLLLHFMSDLCPLKLFDLLNRHVIEGAAALVSEVGDLGRLAC